jgi:hypothetical protein
MTITDILKTAAQAGFDEVFVARHADDLICFAELLAVNNRIGRNHLLKYDVLEDLVTNWASNRKIIPNSNPMAQGLKTLEEVQELLTAINRGSRDEVADAYGDIFVTLIIGAKLSGLELLDCLEGAYDEIRTRRGTLRPDGIFVKEPSQ